jgi:hypothetical protein
MGTNLFSTRYAARVTAVSEDLLATWLRCGLFETEHFAKNTKTQEKTFYFAPGDISRLSEFARRAPQNTQIDLAAD